MIDGASHRYRSGSLTIFLGLFRSKSIRGVLLGERIIDARAVHARTRLNRRRDRVCNFGMSFGIRSIRGHCVDAGFAEIE